MRNIVVIVSALVLTLPGSFAPTLVAQNTPSAASQASATPDPAQGAVWDLSLIFPDDAAAGRERLAILAELPTLAVFQGHLGDSAQTLRKALDRRSQLVQRTRIVRRYAFLKVSADARAQSAQALMASSSDLLGKLQTALAFYDPEILSIGPQKIAAFEAEEPGLASHRRDLQLLLRRADHVLGPEAEAAIAASHTLRQSSSDIHDVFTNGEMPWPSIQVHGKPTQLTRGTYRKLQTDPDRETRRTSFEAYTAALGQFKNTQAALLQAYVGGAAYEAKLRHYPSSAAFLLAEDAMPEDAFDVLTKAAKSEQPALDHYLRLRAKALHLSDPHSYDLAVPLAGGTRTYTLAEGEGIVLKALAPLGQDYVDRLSTGFHQNRMHAISAPGKAPGARTIPMGKNIAPLVLITYTGDAESVEILAHEWGHAMHMDMARAAQPPETADFSVFIGDTPSLLNEMLLNDYMVEHATTPQDRIAALVDGIDTLRGTYYRVLPLMRLEMEERAAADRGEPLTADTITKLHCNLTRAFNGADRGITVVDPGACLTWTTSQEPYDDLYFYKYLVAVSAAAYFAEGVEKGNAAVRDRYFNLLRAGGSDDPYILLKQAGFDAREPAAYDAIGERFGHYVDLLEAELSTSGGLNASERSLK